MRAKLSLWIVLLAAAVPGEFARAASPGEADALAFFGRGPWGARFRQALGPEKAPWLAELYGRMAREDAADLLPDVGRHGIEIDEKTLASAVAAARAATGAAPARAAIPRSAFAPDQGRMADVRGSLAKAEAAGAEVFDGGSGGSGEAAVWRVSASAGHEGFVSATGGIAAANFDAEVSGYRSPEEEVRAGFFMEQRFPWRGQTFGASLYSGLGPAGDRPAVATLKGRHPILAGAVFGDWFAGGVRHAVAPAREGAARLRHGFAGAGVGASWWDETLTLSAAASKSFYGGDTAPLAQDPPTRFSLHRLHPGWALDAVEEFPDVVASVDLSYEHPDGPQTSLSYAYLRRVMGGAAHSVVSAVGFPVADSLTAGLSHQFYKRSEEPGDHGVYLNMDFETSVLSGKKKPAPARDPGKDS